MSHNLEPEETTTTDSFRAGLDRSFTSEPPARAAATYSAAGRRRLARRRSLGVAACVLAIVAVPISIAAADGFLGGTRDGDPAVAAEPRVPEGWRVVSGVGASFAVPSSWSVGSPTQWCVRGSKDLSPMVFVPGEMLSTLVACASPQRWYGAELESDETKSLGLTAEPVRYQAAVVGGGLFPDGAWVAQVDASKGWVLIVATDSRETTQQVLDSLRME